MRCTGLTGDRNWWVSRCRRWRARRMRRGCWGPRRCCGMSGAGSGWRDGGGSSAPPRSSFGGLVSSVLSRCATSCRDDGEDGAEVGEGEGLAEEEIDGFGARAEREAIGMAGEEDDALGRGALTDFLGELQAVA